MAYVSHEFRTPLSLKKAMQRQFKESKIAMCPILGGKSFKGKLKTIAYCSLSIASLRRVTYHAEENALGMIVAIVLKR